MSIFFNSGPVPEDSQLAELWHWLENEYFGEAIALAESVCQDQNAPIEYFCGLALAYGESGYYAEAEQVARRAVGFGEGQWRARHALATALILQGRFMASLDSLGFYRSPAEIYVVRAQTENMGGYSDSLASTLEDALDQDVPPAVYLYLAYLYGTLAGEVPGWGDQAAGYGEVVRFGGYLDVWERDQQRHAATPYGQRLGQQIAAMRRIIATGQ